MITLKLVRHAESLGNVDGSQADTELSERGRGQAERLRETLDGCAHDLIVSSPLRRALETAQLALPGAEPRIDARLGEWARLKDTYIDPVELTPEFFSALSREDTPREESFVDFQRRITSWAMSLPDGACVLAFTHYAVVREAVRALGSLRRTLPDVPHCEVFEVAFDRTALDDPPGR